MALEQRQTSSVPAPRAGPDPSREPVRLAPGIAFLLHYGIAEDDLVWAEAEALRLETGAAEILIAEGLVSAAHYYSRLAQELGLPFAGAGVLLDHVTDPGQAIRAGHARLAGHPGLSFVPKDGSARPAQRPYWLLAPRGDRIELLLRAKRNGFSLPPVAITTPAHFSALVRRTSRHGMARAAAHALEDRDPAFCARRPVEALRSWKSAVFAAFVLLLCILAPQSCLLGFVPLFFVAVAARLLICAGGLEDLPDPPPLPDAKLPLYGILVPLYHEAGMVASLAGHLAALDYPAAKLEIKFLVEASDHATRQALEDLALPPQFEIVTVPEGLPRTKPRALNAGLALIRAGFVTIYDAEDVPEPAQLRKAAAAFASGPPALACLQAQLVIDIEPKKTWTKLFAIEYAALFDLFNKGLAAEGLPMPLGGTSNHFRTQLLREAGGWDAWNVAEDADLGLRLARLGFATRMLKSVTQEQAPAAFGDWFHQRRRWMKGWIQTFLVLGQDPIRVLRELGLRKTAAVFLLGLSLVGGSLLAPFATLAAIAGFCLDGLPSMTDGAGRVLCILWVAVFVMGLLAPLWCAYAGIKARGIRGVWTSLPLVLPYQLLVAAAAWAGLFDLLVAPYHWNKTNHRPPET